MSWLTLKNDSDTAKNSGLFWEKLKNDLKNGTFGRTQLKNIEMSRQSD